MPSYLAYQFDASKLTRERLLRIVDDYFDLSNSNPKFNSSLEWFEWAKSDVKRLRESPRGEEAMMGVEESPIKMAGRLIRKRVKNHPTLEIYFRNRQVEALPYCPPNFTGLNIWAAHSGSEGLIDLIQFKPEMNAYLDMLEIGYTDKSSIIR